ncbi:MAG: amidase [Limnospira sp.]
MNPNDLAFAPALAQAQLIRKGEISPLELVKLYLDRIERLNPQLGCYFTVMAESAIAQARKDTEALTQSPAEVPPFLGVPISIKDLNPVAGVPCSYGSRVLKDRVASDDDGVVARIREAGFIILGKTATPELGSLPYTESEGFPPARNPWNPEYTPGGSSGGAAAAVAGGLCAIAQGSDGGGSIRGPAFCCGAIGLKPSRGRVSNAPVGDHQSGISTNGPIARTVADAAALLDVMSGYITGDPYWLPNPEHSFLSATRRPPRRLRIAVSTEIPPVGVASVPCAEAVTETARHLEHLGHIVEPACPDFGDLIEPFIEVWKAGAGVAEIPKQYLNPMNRWLAEESGSAAQYLRAVSKMQVVSRQIVGFFDRFDILLLPTYMHPTIRVGEYANLTPEQTLQQMINWIAPCPPFNATGQPAIALPTGFDPHGLPVGVQLVGKPADESTLISLAAQLEAGVGWLHLHPPLTR